jgi:uncharacterized phage protein gp47/JayE
VIGLALSLQSFSQMLRNSAAAAQGSCAQLLDLTTGSVIRALLEANASLGLWMQWLILQVLASTRLATSVGTDVDSFVGDYTLKRLLGVAASGVVTLSRFSASGSALVLPGVRVTTGDLSQSFAVTADTTNPSWNTALGGYLVADGVFAITLPVQAVTVGIGGNVQVGTISLLGTGVPGIDTVANALAFSNGADIESDVQVKLRFANYIASLSKATLLAIAYAISQVQQGLSWFINENFPSVGHFSVTVDDGTGEPPAALLSLIYAAIDQVRPIGSTFSVAGPVIVIINVSATIVANVNVNQPSLFGPIISALDTYLDSLPIGTDVSYSRIITVIYGAVSGISNVTNLQINGATSDIAIGPSGVAKAGTVVLS